MSTLRRTGPAALEVADLTVTLPVPGGTLTAVRNVSFTVERGEALGIVGESGSGKSMAALAVMGLLPRSATRHAATMRAGGTDLLALSDKELATRVRGQKIGMIFQEPMTSLNPVYPIGRQLTEAMTHHGGSEREAKARALDLLDAVALPDPKARFNQYPHQFSGGQRQRIMIAMALMNAPDLLIADEPTTALDVTIQAQILKLLMDLRERLGVALVLITHDFGVVSANVERVMVMLKGEAVENGPTREVLVRPRNTYTKRLLASLPKPRSPRHLPEVAPRLVEVTGARRVYTYRPGVFARPRQIEAVADISFTMVEGETLAIVGESGSGKSTLARLLLGLEQADAGTLKLVGKDVTLLSPLERSDMVQPIFQDPYGSLNPRMSVSHIIRRPLDVHGVGTSSQRDEAVRAVMAATGLDPRFAHVFPNQMSGGQRQRVAIARALILRPRIVICDEPTSALDVSIQAQILTLLEGLREKLDLTLLLITHNLGVVRQLADRVIVMRAGRMVEEASVTELFAAPREPYTQELLAAVPKLDL